MTISDGIVGSWLTALDGAVIKITGGSVGMNNGSYFIATHSTVCLSGG